MKSQKDGLIIHTGKTFGTLMLAYGPHKKTFFSFGVVLTSLIIMFDMDQRDLNGNADKSLYDVLPLLDCGYDDEYKLDISKKLI